MRPTLDEIFAEEDEFGLLDVKPAAAAGIATRQPKGAESKANGGMHAATVLSSVDGPCTAKVNLV